MFSTCRAMEEVEKIYLEGEKSRKEELRHSHPILSRIPLWLDSNLKDWHEALVEQHKWRAHEHALALCKQQNLDQHFYFLQRDLTFMREVRLF